MSDEFSKDWPHGYVTRDGRQARVICWDRNSNYPIIALIGPSEVVHCFAKNGKAYEHGTSLPLDLLNAPPPKRRIKGAVNIYRLSQGYNLNLHPSKSSAIAHRDDGCLACIEIDVEEGEGLS